MNRRRFIQAIAALVPAGLVANLLPVRVQKWNVTLKVDRQFAAVPGVITVRAVGLESGTLRTWEVRKLPEFGTAETVMFLDEPQRIESITFKAG